MLFFSKEANDIYKAYTNLFGANDEDMEEEGSDTEGEGTTDGSREKDGDIEGFAYRWGWIYSVDIVSETMKLNWHEVMDLNIIEFLNVRSYIKDKGDWQKKRADEYNKLHNLKIR